LDAIIAKTLGVKVTSIPSMILKRKGD